MLSINNSPVGLGLLNIVIASLLRYKKYLMSILDKQSDGEVPVRLKFCHHSQIHPGSKCLQHIVFSLWVK